MGSIIFEFRRLIKRKLIYVLLAIATILSIFNHFQLQTHSSEQNPQSIFESYYVQLISVFRPNTGDYIEDLRQNQQISPGQAHFYSMTEDQNYQEYTSSQGYQSSQWNIFIKYLQEGIEIDQIHLNTYEEALLTYGQHLADYLNQQTDPKISSGQNGAVSQLIYGFDFLFGNIPIIFISLMILMLATEDLGRMHHQWRWTLPTKRRHLLMTYLPLTFSLALIYILLVTLITASIAMDTHQGLGDINYPLRVLNIQDIYQPAWQILITCWAIFFLKTLFCLNLALCIASIFRQERVSWLIFTATTGFISMMTQFMPWFQQNLNSFYQDIQNQYLGKTVLKQFSFTELIQQNRATYQYIDQQIRWPVIIIWLIISLCFFFSAYYLYPRNKFSKAKPRWRAVGTTKSHNTKKFGSLQFESRKLKAYFANLISYLLIIMVIFSCFVFILRQDQHSEEVFVSAPFFEQDYQLIHDDFSAKIKLIEVAEQKETDPNFISQLNYQKQHLNETMEFFDQSYQTIKNRQAAFRNGETNHFYQSFQDELIMYFNPYSTIDSATDGLRYFPRYQYYPTGDFPSDFAYKLSSQRLLAFQEREIPPILGTAITLTPYDEAVNPADRLQDQLTYQAADQSFLGLVYRFVSVFRFDLFCILLLVCFMGGAYNNEGDRYEHLYWLYTLPNNPKRIHFDKIYAQMVQAFKYFSLAILVLFVLGMSRRGFGQWEFPLVYYDQLLAHPNILTYFDNSFHWLNLGNWFVNYCIWYIVSSLFILNLMAFLSTYIPKQLTTSILTSLLLVLGYYFGQVIPNNLTIYFPFAHLNGCKVLDGSIMVPFQWTNSSLFQSLFVLIIWSAIFYFLTYQRIRKNRLLEVKA